MTEAERFVEHLIRATAIVDAWPEWKKRSLGWPYEKTQKETTECVGMPEASVRGAATVVVHQKEGE